MRILSGILVLTIIMGLCSMPANAAGYRLYYGNIHSHTSEGGDDNKQIYTTPEDAYSFARDIGKLDFFSISPHNHMINQQVFNKLKNRYENFGSSDFVPIYGSEWGVLSVVGHIGTYMTESMNEIQIATHSDPYEHMYNYFNWLAKQKTGFAVLNHPETFHFGYYYNPIGDDRVTCMEVFAGPAFEGRIDQARNPISYERKVLPILNKGWHVGMIGNQDNHMRTWGILTGVRTGAYATSKTTDAIVKAFQARRTFATSDKNAKIMMTAKDDSGRTRYMGEQLYNTKRIIINVTTSDKDGEIPKEITLYSDVVDNGELGVSVARVHNQKTLKYTATSDHFERVFVAKVVQKDGDTIWSSPIWVSLQTPYQGKLARLMILKKQLQTVRKHLSLVGEDSPYGGTIKNAVKYLSNVHRLYSRSVYDELRSAKGNTLRTMISEVGEFITNLPVHDAKLIRTDIRRLAKQIYLTSDETEFIDNFLKNLANQEADEELNEDELNAQVEKMIQARNYDEALIILDFLMEKFPANADKYRLKMLSLYSLLEAFEMAQSLGGEVLSNTSLDIDMAYDVYNAMGLSYKRQYSKAPASRKFKLIELSKMQYAQLLKDFPDLDDDRKAKTHNLVGSRYFTMMKLVKNDPQRKKKYFIEAVKSLNRALKLAKDPSDIIDINESISEITIHYEATVESYLETIEKFQEMISEYNDESDAMNLYKNIGDLYKKLSSKISKVTDKEKYLQLAMDNYIIYLKKNPPRDKSTIYYEIAHLYFKLKKYSKAASYFARVEKENYKSRKLEYSIYYKGMSYQYDKKNAEAIKAYKKLLKDFPNFKYCYYDFKNKQVADPMKSVVGVRMTTLLEGRELEEDLMKMEGSKAGYVNDSLFYMNTENEPELYFDNVCEQ